MAQLLNPGKEEAIAAMKAAPGKPPPEIFRRPGDGAATYSQVEADVPKPRTILSTLQDMRDRDRDDYDAIMGALRNFLEQKRRDLETLERWLG